MKPQRRLLWFRGLVVGGAMPLLAAVLPLGGFGIPAAGAATWNVTDVLAAIGTGKYTVFNNTGTVKETIDDGLGGFTTGCAFNPTRNKLYTTNFSAGKVVVYDDAHPHTILQTITTGDSLPESVVFDGAGNFYVGHAGGAHSIKKFNAAGTLVGTFNPAIDGRGTDWVELAADQCTIFYTSEGGKIKRFNVCTNTQLADFADIGGVSFALRLLPPFDGSGGLLVANLTTVKRLNGSGAVVQSYDAAGQDAWFALSLDPNGTSFWSGSFDSGDFFRFNINAGAVEVGPIATGSTDLFGLCVKGEITAAVSAIPTLTEWAQILMVAVLVASGLWVLRRRRVTWA